MANYLILGATGGIGSATTRRLRQARRGVMLIARDEGRLRNLSAEVDAPYQCVDATSLDEVTKAAQGAEQILGELNGIANFAGSLLLKPALATSAGEWHQTLATNLTSAFATVRAAHATMKRFGGAVVLRASVAADYGFANHEAIAPPKAGVLGLMRFAAATYARNQIRFNAIAPGLIKTGLTARLWQAEKVAEASASMHPLRRLGEPDEIASLAERLLAADSNWVTGQTFGFDGGLSTVRA